MEENEFKSKPMAIDRSTEPAYTYSRLSADTLASRLLPQYDIPSPAKCEFFVLGLHDNYLVEAGADRYFLKVYRTDWRSKEEILFELELLTFLRERRVPVAFPLMSRAGEYTVAIEAPEGTRQAALFSYAAGKEVGKNLNKLQGYQLGKTVAELHIATDQFKGSYHRQHLSLEYLLNNSLDLLTVFLQHRQDDLAYLDRVRTEAIVRLKGLPKSASAYGICMGDVHPGNAHFTEDGQITLFDFDQCGYGWRAFEIGKFVAVAHRTGIRREVVQAFVAGYESVRELDKQELLAIPTFVKVAHVWMLGIYARNVNLVGRKRLSDEFFTERIRLLRTTKSNFIIGGEVQKPN